MPSTKPTKAASVTVETLKGRFLTMYEKRWEESFKHHGLKVDEAKSEALAFVERAMRIEAGKKSETAKQQALFDGKLPRVPAHPPMPKNARD